MLYHNVHVVDHYLLHLYQNHLFHSVDDDDAGGYDDVDGADDEVYNDV